METYKFLKGQFEAVRVHLEPRKGRRKSTRQRRISKDMPLSEFIAKRQNGTLPADNDQLLPKVDSGDSGHVSGTSTLVNTPSHVTKEGTDDCLSDGSAEEDNTNQQLTCATSTPKKSRSLKFAVRRLLGKDRLFYLVRTLVSSIEEEKRAREDFIEALSSARKITVPLSQNEAEDLTIGRGKGSVKGEYNVKRSPAVKGAHSGGARHTMDGNDCSKGLPEGNPEDVHETLSRNSNQKENGEEMEEHVSPTETDRVSLPAPASDKVDGKPCSVVGNAILTENIGDDCIVKSVTSPVEGTNSTEQVQSTEPDFNEQVLSKDFNSAEQVPSTGTTSTEQEKCILPKADISPSYNSTDANAAEKVVENKNVPSFKEETELQNSKPVETKGFSDDEQHRKFENEDIKQARSSLLIQNEKEQTELQQSKLKKIRVESKRMKHKSPGDKDPKTKTVSTAKRKSNEKAKSQNNKRVDKTGKGNTTKQTQENLFMDGSVYDQSKIVKSNERVIRESTDLTNSFVTASTTGRVYFDRTSNQTVIEVENSDEEEHKLEESNSSESETLEKCKPKESARIHSEMKSFHEHKHTEIDPNSYMNEDDKRGSTHPNTEEISDCKDRGSDVQQSEKYKRCSSRTSKDKSLKESVRSMTDRRHSDAQSAEDCEISDSKTTRDKDVKHALMLRSNRSDSDSQSLQSNHERFSEGTATPTSTRSNSQQERIEIKNGTYLNHKSERHDNEKTSDRNSIIVDLQNLYDTEDSENEKRTTVSFVSQQSQQKKKVSSSKCKWRQRTLPKDSRNKLLPKRPLSNTADSKSKSATARKPNPKRRVKTAETKRTNTFILQETYTNYSENRRLDQHLKRYRKPDSIIWGHLLHVQTKGTGSSNGNYSIWCEDQTSATSTTDTDYKRADKNSLKYCGEIRSPQTQINYRDLPLKEAVKSVRSSPRCPPIRNVSDGTPREERIHGLYMQIHRTKSPSFVDCTPLDLGSSTNTSDILPSWCNNTYLESQVYESKVYSNRYKHRLLSPKNSTQEKLTPGCIWLE